MAGIAQLRGAVGHQFVMFVQAMVTAGVSAKMLSQVLRIRGEASRVHELWQYLKQAQRTSEGGHATFEDGDAIQFTDVTVETPQHVTLVEDLSFRVDYGSSLLLVSER